MTAYGSANRDTAPAIDPAWSVNELLERRPAAVTVLNGCGIDTCCGGARSLADAAREDGLDLPTLLAALDAAVAGDA